MVRTKIGEALTDNNGIARIQLPINDSKSFTVEAVSHELTAQKQITNQTFDLTVTAPSTVVSDESFNITGSLKVNGNPSPANVSIEIIIYDDSGTSIISSFIVKTTSSGTFSWETKLSGSGEFAILAEMNMYPVIRSDNVNIKVLKQTKIKSYLPEYHCRGNQMNVKALLYAINNGQTELLANKSLFVSVDDEALLIPMITDNNGFIGFMYDMHDTDSTTEHTVTIKFDEVDNYGGCTLSETIPVRDCNKKEGE